MVRLCDHHPDVSAVALADHVDELVHSAEVRVELVQVESGVAVEGMRCVLWHRTDPDSIEAQRMNVVEPRRDAGPRATAVCVDVSARSGGVAGRREGEAVSDYLIDGARLPLLGCAGCDEQYGLRDKSGEKA